MNFNPIDLTTSLNHDFLLNHQPKECHADTTPTASHPQLVPAWRVVPQRRSLPVCLPPRVPPSPSFARPRIFNRRGPQALQAIGRIFG
eukprot:354852-Chlamydomonas_euryale.AAC.5